MNRKSPAVLPGCIPISLCIMTGFSAMPTSGKEIPPDLTPEQLNEARQALTGAVFLDPSESAEARVDDLVDRMTVDEKITYLAGTGFDMDAGIIGETHPLPRLGVP